MAQKFHLRNFGCRASQADGAAIETLLSSHGLESIPDHRSADFVVLNTCTVTAAADDEVRQVVRRMGRESPGARIVVTGCYAQRAPAEVAALPGVTLVVGNSHKAQLAELLTASYHGGIHVGDVFADMPMGATPRDRSRPNLKIQDGCSNRCSFCIIPSVRGRSRSAPLAQILDQIRALSAGYPEIVLTGINLGRWGREAGPGMRLADLLRRVLNETDVRRLRLSSVEPMDWSDELLQLMAHSSRIAEHMHAPLQSGSDTVLRRMHRKYRPQHYEHRVSLARQLMPDAAIGADVMTGFPCETDAEFEQTRAFIERMPLTYLHIFPYSERPGTAAADSLDQVPWDKRRERARVLKVLGQSKNVEFRRRMAGRTLSAVTLGNGEAMSSNYIAIELSTPRERGQLIELKTEGLTETGLRERGAFPLFPG